jgi:hypothetical protein
LAAVVFARVVAILLARFLREGRFAARLGAVVLPLNICAMRSTAAAATPLMETPGEFFAAELLGRSGADFFARAIRAP